MSTLPTQVSLADIIAVRKQRVIDWRNTARTQFAEGIPALRVVQNSCQNMESLLTTLIEETIGSDPARRESIARQGAVLTVGGTGRGELCPYSDIDLLFLQGRDDGEFQQFVTKFIQNCWDSRLKVGHAFRSVSACLQLAKIDPQIATCLIEARYLWGDKKLAEQLTRRFYSGVVSNRSRAFIDQCLEARSENWSENKPPAQELEPDIKSSSGGLRDLHLIRWIAYARYGKRELHELEEIGCLSAEDALKLREAWEFLTRIRIDLHLFANREHDRLTRDEQLRIAEDRGFTGSPTQRPVEQFMQEYFRHSSELAAITRRFVAVERPRTITEHACNMVVGHRAESIYFVGVDRIDVAKRYLPQVCESVESLLQLYKTAALYHLPLAPQVQEAVKAAVPGLNKEITAEAAKLFLEIFRYPKAVSLLLRSLFDTGLLDVIIPDVTHIRNLMQFNQYHHFTVDEHTLRAVETAARFEEDETAIGAAYRSLKNKHILHLAVLLHDIGKGLGGDHSLVGEEIAVRIGARLQLPQHQINQLGLLVRLHLVMADLAFRRDTTDIKLLLNFTREIGTPETLRMLYVLTAADVTAVGPGTWSLWKSNLLTDLFDRCLLMLSGKRYSYLEQERIDAVKTGVFTCLQQRGSTHGREWVDAKLRGFSAYYLTSTPVARIADDLEAISQLDEQSIEVNAVWDEATGTTEYRVITRSPLATKGCFHKMAGVLTAKRLEILSADINTTSEGVVVDSYVVVDRDYAYEPPAYRIDEVAQLLREVLNGTKTIEEIFLRNTRYGQNTLEKPTADHPTRVNIDNDSSDSRTIIDVFAYDRPGLLYTVARTLHDCGLSIDLAKISTATEQVIDVFYVQESDGKKVGTEARIEQIRAALMHALDEFFDHEYEQFQPS